MLPHHHRPKQHPGHAGAKCCSAETRTRDHAAQSAQPKIGERSRFQKGKRDTRADHCDGGLEKSTP